MIRVGIVGIGFMGWIHYLSYRGLRGLRVAAICTRDSKRRSGDWRGIQGNFGPPGERVDLSRVATYSQLDDLLADASIDLVDLCLPPALHAEATVRALRAGKHVFCEKPIAVSSTDAKRMLRAAQQTDRLLMIGHVLPLFDEYQWALQTAANGTYGKILGGNFKRVISHPDWLPDFYDPHIVGGPMIDLHVHDAHCIRLLFGMPQAVSSQGRMRGEVVEYWNSLFHYEDSHATVCVTGGVIQQPGRSFTHGFEVHFERATVGYELAVVDGQAQLILPCTVYPAKGKSFRPRLGAGDPLGHFRAEVRAVAQGIQSGSVAPFLCPQAAFDALRLCHTQTEAVRVGRPVRVKA